ATVFLSVHLRSPLSTTVKGWLASVEWPRIAYTPKRSSVAGNFASGDPVFRHHFFIQVHAKSRFLRHDDVAVHHGKALLGERLPQRSLFDAIFEVLGIGQGGDEVQAGGDVDPRLI